MNPASGCSGSTTWKSARGAARSRADSGGRYGLAASPNWTATEESAVAIAPRVWSVAPVTAAAGPTDDGANDAGLAFAPIPHAPRSVAAPRANPTRTNRGRPAPRRALNPAAIRTRGRPSRGNG